MRNPTPVRCGALLNLLQIWCDGLIAHQITQGSDRGGFGCPACGFVHGRSGDAVYPLLAIFSRTGDEKYRRAALQVFEWSEHHVSQPDGSWLNENYAGAWKGISCFSALALGESLRHYGDHLTPETQHLWRERLRRGADFLLDFMTFEVGDINYPISTAAALALAWTLIGDEKYRRRARELAYFGLDHFTQNSLLWGEGPRGRGDISPRGLRPIDVGYNVEESLPNLALYGELTGDKTVLDAVVASLRAHLPFLLSDGGWDAGWCSRQYKWTYWGSRTSDGCAFGYAALRGHDPRFATAAALNTRLLATCTHGGLLNGGPHLHSRGIAPCIHHTFCHAKGLAAALDVGFLDEKSSALEKPGDGVREWKEGAVFQVSCGGWRASVTANDLPHTSKRGGYPSGGSLSLLWHEATGPLCVASMNDYLLYEGSNMQTAANDAEKFVLTPRLELLIDGELFSSLYDGAAQIAWHTDKEAIELTAVGILKNQVGEAAEDADYQFVYRFVGSIFELKASCALPDVRLVFPLVSAQHEPISFQDKTLAIRKPNAIVYAQLEGAQWENDSAERVFNFVPGVEAHPLTAVLKGEAWLTLTIGSEVSCHV
ncbi:hypothetical protein IAD21_00133 [Abditibacteriota bacterium]|nr:hypothetical protein IAD21_00133 [Abditibacteriota bacterium]